MKMKNLCKYDFCQFSAQIATLASLLDVTTPKPGNVHRFSDFKDMGQEHFMTAAIAAQPFFFEGVKRGKKIYDGNLVYSQAGIGELIKKGVLATKSWGLTQNCNLGILLLLIPLCTVSICAQNEGEGWTIEARQMLSNILDQSTSIDSINVLTAISLAQPAGLGKSEKYDVFEPQTTRELEDNQIGLKKLFAEGKERDLICQQYTTNFKEIFTDILPKFHMARKKQLSLREAILDIYLNILATYPDTHLSRKFGVNLAYKIQQKGVQTLNEGSVFTKRGISAIYRLDKYFREKGYNPGTTADFTVASLFVYWLDLWNKDRKLDLSHLITPGKLLKPWVG